MDVAKEVKPKEMGNAISRPRVVLAGGSGFIGGSLAAYFAKENWDVVVLTRKERPNTDLKRFAVWDGRKFGAWVEEIEGASAVVNLAGDSLAQSWTTDSKARMVASRIEATRVLGEAINEVPHPPASWVNASAVGIYGDRGEEYLHDNSSLGERGDFLVDLCTGWEAEADRFLRPETALAKVRIGHVLGSGGGMLKPLSLLTKCFLGGHFGTGSQYQPWIHLDDLCRLIYWVASERRQGVFNATGPDPSTNQFFMATLRAVLNRPWSPPIPAFLLKLAALFGAPPARLVLDSQRAVPTRAMQEGFSFQYVHLQDALSDLYSKR